MRHTLLVMLALLSLACTNDDDAPAVLDPAEARVVIVSGDRQEAPVASAPAGALVPAAEGDSLYDVLPEALVVRVVEADSAEPTASVAGPSGLSFALVPAGTDLHWQVREATGCGRAFGSTTETDDSAYSVNRWITGTRATTCHMDVGRILKDGTIVIDTTYVSVQHAGPPALTPLEGRVLLESMADTIRLCETADILDPRGHTCLFTDQHGNPAAFRVEGTGWLIGTVDTTAAGSILPALVRADTLLVAKDTATLYVYSDTTLIADARVTLEALYNPGWRIQLDARMLNLAP